MGRLRSAALALLAVAAACSDPAPSPTLVGPWRDAGLQPGAVTEVVLDPIPPDMRGEFELQGAVEGTTWVAVAGGREVAAGRLHVPTTGLYGLHAAGPTRLSLTLPSNVPAATLRYRLRLRPAFVAEEDESLAPAPQPCGAAGCTGVIGWPADSDAFLVSRQGGAGTEVRLTGVPGIAWDLRVTEGTNLKAQAASVTGEGTSVIVPGGGSAFVVTVRSRTDGASPLPYRLSLRSLGGPLATP